jgi:hypothetical protein
MDYPQPHTPLQTHNKTSAGIINSEDKQQKSKTMDMRFYWLKDHEAQDQFCIYWKPGIGNKADYFTKHHPAKHHQAFRPFFLH